MNIFDFENADIAKLAIHIRETLHDGGVRPISFVKAGPGDRILIPGRGSLIGVAVIEATGVAGTFALSDGPSAESRFLAVDALGIGGVLTMTFGTAGFTFLNELVIADLAAATAWSGQVFVRPLDRD